jgi:hypothetical protein
MKPIALLLLLTFAQAQPQTQPQGPQGIDGLLGLAMTDAEQGRFREGERRLAAAENLAKTKEAKLQVHAGAIRYYTRALSPKDWLDKAKDHFDDGIRITNTYSPLQYHMARAYIAANSLTRAQDLYAQVVALRGPFAAEADKEWKKTQKVLRASPATRMGAGIAMQDRISRADLCVLLVQELGLGKIFGTAAPSPTVVPSDILQHASRVEILDVLKWRVRGLEVRPGGVFAPNEPVKRGEFAFVLEDILLKATNDATLASRYVGTERSPFSDVQAGSARFNSVMTATSRGLLEAGLDGKFNPDSDVDGADTLLALRRLAETTGKR